jgi:SAM-dependent methyltransferase
VSLTLFEAALSGAPGDPERELWLRRRDGARVPLAVERWAGRPDQADHALLDRALGPVIDVGCGPGRLTAELLRRGTFALGVDIAEAAVRLTRAAGGLAVHRSVWGQLPGTGRWRCAMLADGNIGIGGNPARLLARVARLVRRDGRLLVELDPPGTASWSGRVRVESAAGGIGSWFDWAVLGSDDVVTVAAQAGLSVRSVWSGPGERWFAELAPVTGRYPGVPR